MNFYEDTMRAFAVTNNTCEAFAKFSCDFYLALTKHIADTYGLPERDVLYKYKNGTMENINIIEYCVSIHQKVAIYRIGLLLYGERPQLITFELSKGIQHNQYNLAINVSLNYDKWEEIKREILSITVLTPDSFDFAPVDNFIKGSFTGFYNGISSYYSGINMGQAV